MKFRSASYVLVLLAAAGLFVPASALAEDQVRLAIVDVTRALANSKEGKVAEKAITALMEKRRESLRPDEEELRRLSEEYQAQQFVLSKDALRERELDIVKRRNDLERNMAAAREDIEIEERKRMQPLLQRVQKVLKDLGREKGFTVILEKSSPGMLYFEDGLDITDLVTQRLDESS